MAHGLVNGDKAARAAMWKEYARINFERAKTALVEPGGPLGFKISNDCEAAAKNNLKIAKQYA